MNEKTHFISPAFDNRFVVLLAGHLRTLIKEASLGSDHDWQRFLGALYEHEVSVFIRDLPHEERKVAFDLADDQHRRFLKKELNRPLAPRYQRVELKLGRAFTDSELEESALVLGWHWAMLMFARRPFNPNEIHLDRSRIATDSVPMSELEQAHWLLSITADDLRHCLFNMLRPHVSAVELARLLRHRYYMNCAEQLPSFAQFEKSLAGISERLNALTDEASGRLSDRIDSLFAEATREQQKYGAAVQAEMDAAWERTLEELRKRRNEGLKPSQRHQEQAAQMLKSNVSLF